MIKNKLSLEATVYYVNGLHCPSCELLIEKRILEEKTVEEVNVSLSENTVTVKHLPDNSLTPEYFDEIFKKDGYRFSAKSFNGKAVDYGTCSFGATATETVTSSNNSSLTPYLIAGLFILSYFMLSQSGFSSLVSVNSTSSLPVFLFFGLIAGFSSCAALVGGIILSLSKQWLSSYKHDDTMLTKAQPHILFNAGRIIGYTLIGAVLGAIGGFFKLSPLFSAFLVIGVSLLMILLGLNMVGIKALKNFQIKLPKAFTGKIADEANFSTRSAPLIMGALTFLLPCGFTITTQALALASSNPLQGALILGLFALGTTPGLLLIGLGSVKLYGNPQLSKQFSIIAGLLVLFIAFININSQLTVLGVSNVNELITSSANSQIQTADNIPPVIDGIQVVKIEANSYSYTPNKIRLLANTPTRWEVNANGISGCTNAIISRGLFKGQIDLVDGQISTKEFTSPKPGIYKYSCWMGMVSGTVEVVDASGSTGTTTNVRPVESGAKICGCGGGGGSASGTCGGLR